MPTGPKGQKRKADVIGNAVLIARIATGEDTDAPADDGKDKAAQALGSKGANTPEPKPRGPNKKSAEISN